MAGDCVFDEGHYGSNDGFMTSVWGPLAWNFLHMISFNYPVKPTPQQKKDYARFVLHLGKVLPCRYCRDNFPRNLRAAGFGNDAFASRDAFSRFVYRLHDGVNRMLKKPSGGGKGLRFEDVRERYEQFRSRCLTSTERRADRRAKKESGCTEPLFANAKGRCVLRIVPQDSAAEDFKVHRQCRVRRRRRRRGRARQGEASGS